MTPTARRKTGRPTRKSVKSSARVPSGKNLRPAAEKPRRGQGRAPSRATTRVTVVLPSHLWRWLRDQAVAENRDVDGIVANAIEGYQAEAEAMSSLLGTSHSGPPRKRPSP